MFMRQVTAIAVLTGLCAGLPAQAPVKSQEELIKLRTEKLAKEVFKKADWVTDFDKARAQAKQSGKLLFTYFTRSYSA
jgi:hypothetical protein